MGKRVTKPININDYAPGQRPDPKPDYNRGGPPNKQTPYPAPDPYAERFRRENPGADRQPKPTFEEGHRSRNKGR